MKIEFKKKNKTKIIIIILFIEFLLFFKKIYGIYNSELETYYSQYLCSLLILNNGKYCLNEVLNNYDFFYFIKGIRKNVYLSINIKRLSLIENIIILLGIIPFLKNNSIIRYGINTYESNKLYKKLFSYKKIKNGKIHIDFSDFKTVKTDFNNLINYIWEFIPRKQILDNLRYIISNYYNDSCANIFEKTLNRNYEYFIKYNKSIVFNNSFKKELISK